MKRTVQNGKSFLVHKYDFPQLQLFDFVDFEDSPQRMSNTNLSILRSLDSFLLAFPLEASKNNINPNYPLGCGAKSTVSISGNKLLQVFALTFSPA
jgi:hypothetical protein